MDLNGLNVVFFFDWLRTNRIEHVRITRDIMFSKFDSKRSHDTRFFTVFFTPQRIYTTDTAGTAGKSRATGCRISFSLNEMIVEQRRDNNLPGLDYPVS